MKNYFISCGSVRRLALCAAVVSAFFLPSCQPESGLRVEDNSPPVNPYAISKERALSSLQAFMASDGLPGTKSSDTRKVSNVLELRMEEIRTKVFGGELIPDVPEDVENLFYVANFEGEQGYAILAADERIGEEILAVTESGSISQEFMQYVLMGLLSNERPVFPDYPLTGPGIYQDPDNPDLLCMNPNTVDLYISAEEDTLVGNFAYTYDNLPEPVVIPSSQGNFHQNLIPTPRPEDLGFLLCVDYALMQIGDTTVIVPPGTVYPVTTTEEWRVTSMVQPMLSQFRYWNQRSPFNTFIDNAVAGCFNLAIAKLMTYYEFPSDLEIEGVTIDWQAIKSDYQIGNGAQSISYLLWAISNGTCSWYFRDATFTFPKKAVRFMNIMGFVNADRYHFKIERVMEMIDQGKPFIIYGMPNINIFDSHAWNIDGYKIKDLYEVSHYSDGTTTSRYNKTQKMVHCDFGREGQANGYYLDKIFYNRNNPDAEFDSGSPGSGLSFNYNNNIRIIMFDYPN